jgi:hypothetical protein
MSIYLIKRGPKPSWHKAPFHPVVICAKKRVAEFEAGWAGDKSWIWMRRSRVIDGEGFLLLRWNGLDIDYGHVVRSTRLPSGVKTGFAHHGGPWKLLRGAIWWDDKPMSASFENAGVLYPPDYFTQQWILDQIADDNVSGCGNRPPPPWWPQVAVVKADDKEHVRSEAPQQANRKLTDRPGEAEGGSEP